MNFNELLKQDRLSNNVSIQRTNTEALESDRSRIIFSAPFRRLQRKAQVFPLESNAGIRTRLTHSLEVSDIGRWIAYRVSEGLINKFQLTQSNQLAFILAIENACLLHDIGNPPFGHFGEAAIRNWAQEWEKKFAHIISNEKNRNEVLEERNNLARNLMKDFIWFDGNPQGLRILTRLQRDKDKFSLNLTFTTLLSFIKYAVCTDSIENQNEKKKAGYFSSEVDLVKRMKDSFSLKLSDRFPLSLIMEASDDIAYCMSDIEDGIEKRIISYRTFFDEIREDWVSLRGDETSLELPGIPGNKPDSDQGYWVEEFLKFKTSYSRFLINSASKAFLEMDDAALKNNATVIFQENSVERKAINCLKNFSRKRLFRSEEAENPELAGYQIISGILKEYERLLVLSKDQFFALIESRKDPKRIYKLNLDLELRLFDKLPFKHVEAYLDQVKEIEALVGISNGLKMFYEWYLRCHLVVDFVSGMTDVFALNTYQILRGIEYRW